MKFYRVVICGLFLSNVWAQAGGEAVTQQTTAGAGQRPRIGLVLEGGGALGLAHVGVIRWFEENRIPVDMIAGTSMGGLVGGIYASGKSPEQIKALVQDIKWNVVLLGTTPYTDLSFRRKEDRREYPTAFEFGLKAGTQFPSGFNSGQQVGLILDRVGLPYSDMNSFDDLPIPFRCVATDLVSGKVVVLDRGSLAEALRSTMAIPAFFVPVRDGKRVLVDGGLLDNLPVDVARRMGADIVIAVHLKTPPLDPNKPLTSVGVLERSALVSIEVNELASMEKADIILTAETARFGVNDYKLYEQIEAEGYKAAQSKSALLSRLQVGESEWQQLVSERSARQRPVPIPQFVEVTGATGHVQEGLQQELADLAGKPIDPKELDQKMMAITGLGRFARAGYRETVKEGKSGLLIEAWEKEYAPPTVHPLFTIDGSDYKNVLFQVGGRITFMDVGGFGSEWRNDLVAGSEYGWKTEFFHPFNSYTRWFVAAHGTADSSPFYVYQRDKLLGEYRDRIGSGGLDVGYTFGRTSEIRAGYEAGYQKISEEIGAPVTPVVRGRYGITSLKFRLERFDDPVIPRSGTRVESTFHFYDRKPGTADVVPTVEMRFGLAERMSEKTSVLMFASGGTSFSTRNTGFPPFSLGGPLRLGAFGTNEMLTNQYFLLQPALLYKMRELSPLLRQNVYLLSMYEAGKAYGQSPNTMKVTQDVTIGVLFQTVFGPIVFGGAIGDDQHRKAFFKVGQFF